MDCELWGTNALIFGYLFCKQKLIFVAFTVYKGFRLNVWLITLETSFVFFSLFFTLNILLQSLKRSFFHFCVWSPFAHHAFSVPSSFTVLRSAFNVRSRTFSFRASCFTHTKRLPFTQHSLYIDIWNSVHRIWKLNISILDLNTY